MDLGQCTVCVIDDEPDVLEGICENLSSIMAQVKGFPSAIEAIAAFEGGFKPHVTIVDLKMPKLNGLDFIDQCYQKKLGGKFIISSGQASKNDLARAINLGDVKYLEKPYSIRDLTGVIDKIAENLDSKKNSIDSLVVKKKDELIEIYFKTLVLAEEYMANNGIAFFDNEEIKQTYNKLKKDERRILSEIENLKMIAV